MASAKNNELNFNLTKIRSLKYLSLTKRKPNVARWTLYNAQVEASTDVRN